MDLFVTHELLHGIHYSYNPCFYPKYYNSIEEKYFKRMIAEGIAINLSPTFPQVQLKIHIGWDF